VTFDLSFDVESCFHTSQVFWQWWHQKKTVFVSATSQFTQLFHLCAWRSQWRWFTCVDDGK